MRRIYPALFLVVALFSATGGQLALLQIAAWSGMVVRYSTESGLRRGLVRTFSGKEPCPMCRHVARAQREQAKNEPATLTISATEREVFLAPTPVTLAGAIWPGRPPVAPAGRGPARYEPVPVPPPRGA